MESDRRLRLVVGLILAATVAGGCVQGTSRWNPLGAFADWTPDDEREIGMEFDDALRDRITVIDDPVVSRFLEDLGQTLEQGVEPEPYIYRFRVIADPSLNAFAVPGGYIYIHSGTLIAASSIDELAAVVGHEIAHVKERHHARMRKASQLPDLVAGVGSLAAAVVTGEPGIFFASQSINIAAQLKFGRELEAEADTLGAVIAARAGFDPGGAVRFFGRVLEADDRGAIQAPPYLFTHPDVEHRIESARDRARILARAPPSADDWTERLRRSQARLAMLLAADRPALPLEPPEATSPAVAEQLAEANRLTRSGDAEAALVFLETAGGLASRDPRVSFQIGEAFLALGRPEDAAAAWERTIELDPTGALVQLNLGRAYAELGNPPLAVFHTEKAVAHAGGRGVRDRARWELWKLTFGVLRSSGLADGSRAQDAETPAGEPRTTFGPQDRALAWWGELSPRFAPFAKDLEVRWVDPAGSTALEGSPRLPSRGWATSVLRSESALAPGEWIVEVRLRGDRVETRAFPVAD